MPAVTRTYEEKPEKTEEVLSLCLLFRVDNQSNKGTNYVDIYLQGFCLCSFNYLMANRIKALWHLSSMRKLRRDGNFELDLFKIKMCNLD